MRDLSDLQGILSGVYEDALTYDPNLATEYDPPRVRVERDEEKKKAELKVDLRQLFEGEKVNVSV